MSSGIVRRTPQSLRASTQGGAEVALDAIDRRILAELQRSGRITNQALAETVGLSPSACLARVRRLEADGVIAGYQARLTLKSQHPRDLARFEAAMNEIPEVIEAAQVSGPFDFLLKVVTRDVHAWSELADALIEADLGVDKITSHILMKQSKAFAGYPI